MEEEEEDLEASMVPTWDAHWTPDGHDLKWSCYRIQEGGGGRVTKGILNDGP